MRIALVLHGWPPAAQGGTGLYVAALAQALAGHGHAVAIVAPQPDPGHAGPPRVQGVAGQGVVEGVVIATRPPQRWEETWRRPDLDAALRGWLARWRPDVVHVHHLAHASLGWLRAARAEGARLVLTLHDYNLPCARGQLVDRELAPCPGPEAARCARCIGEHLALSPGTARLGARLAGRPALRQAARRALAPRAPAPAAEARAADRLASVSAALALPHRLLAPSHDLCARFARLGLRRPEHWPLPLVQPVAPAPEPPPGPVRLLFASALIPTKGPDRLLAAFARLAPGAATLTLAGPAPPFDGHPGWARDLEAQVRRTPGATWRGEVPPAEVPALLAAHDVLVLPSRWPENSPLVVREASAAGLRLILPAEGGAGELVPDAPRIAPDDDAALLAALEAEVERGRGRRAPLPWPDASMHALSLSREVYGAVTG